MKTVNANYGIDSIPEKKKDRTWYRWYRFPLVPIISYRPANEYNTSSLSISWLMFRIWTMDSLRIEVGLDLDDVGFRIYGQLLYLRIHVWLLAFPESWSQRLWRKPKYHIE